MLARIRCGNLAKLLSRAVGGMGFYSFQELGRLSKTRKDLSPLKAMLT